MLNSTPDERFFGNVFFYKLILSKLKQKLRNEEGYHRSYYISNTADHIPSVIEIEIFYGNESGYKIGYDVLIKETNYTIVPEYIFRPSFQFYTHM